MEGTNAQSRPPGLTEHPDEGKNPREHQLCAKIGDALQEAQSVAAENPTRENSLAITYLETAAWRAEQDRAIKEAVDNG